jgi:very-short-patch-repair endonuclease
MGNKVTFIDAEFFRGRDAIAQGILTQRELREGPFRRLYNGIYVSPGVEITHELRCRAVSLFRPEAVIGGRSALTVHGVELARATDPVEVVVPRDARVRRARGLSMRAVRIWPAEWKPWHGGKLATPLRAAFDVLTAFPPRIAVGCVDAALRADVVDRDALGRLVAVRHDDGVIRARQSFELLDPRSESPKESELRVIMELAGIPFEPQVEIELAPGWTVRGDLGRREERMLLEYDGAWHGDEMQVARDRRRRAALRAAGWTVLVLTDHDLRADTPDVVHKVLEARPPRQFVHKLP